MIMTGDGHRRPQQIARISIRAVPALIIVAILFAAWPGYLSFDSAYQFWQARTHHFGDIAPPLLPAWWALWLPLLPATWAPMLTIGALYVLGFGQWAAIALRDGQSRLAWLIACIGPLCPPLVWLLPQLWTDVMLAGACLLVSALMVDTSRRQWQTIAIIALLCAATALRHNAIFATAPLAMFWLWQRDPTASVLRRSAMLSSLLVGVLAFKSLLSMALVTQQLDTWAVTPLHDLQAVSIATGVQRIPTNLVGPGMDVQQLREAFNPYSATLLFSGTRSGIRNPTISPLEPDRRVALMQAWRESWIEPAYWQHRLRMFRALLGTHRNEALAGLGDAPVLTVYRDNPALEFSHPLAHATYRRIIETLRSTPVFAAGWYLLLATAIMAWRWRRITDLWRPAVLALFTSIWLYTLPYFFLAPSAEARYLLWPALASWMLILLSLFGRDRRPSGFSEAKRD